MTLRSTLARTLAVLFAIAQLLLPPVAAWADAANGREASARAMAVVHIEAQTDNGCPQAHPADCLLCHAASGLFGQPAVQTLLCVGYTRSARTPVGWYAAWASADRQWSARPRAPPALT